MKKTRFAYLIILFFSLIFIYLYGGVLSWSFFYFITILPIISFINLFIIYKSFSFEEKTNKTQYIKGDNLIYTCEIIIHHFLPLAYIILYIKTPETYMHDLLDKKELFISNKKTVSYTYKTRCTYRGKYVTGVDTFEFIDVLNLFRLTYSPKIKNSIIIYPKIKIINESDVLSLSTSQQHISFFNANSGSDSTPDIRKYLYGDSSKLIHWKLSSKIDELLIRKRETTLDNQTIIAIDFKKLTMDPKKRLFYEDLLIEDILATIYYLMTHNIPVDVVFNYEGLKSQYINTSTEFYKLYTLLAKISFSDNANLENILSSAFNNKEKANSIYIYCLTLRKELLNDLITLKSMGKQLKIKYCFSEKSTHTYLETQGITNKQITIEKERERISYEK